MRIRIGLLVATLAFVAACDNATGPRGQADDSALLDFDVTSTLDSATLAPRGTSYDTEAPANIRLTDEQKIAIKALHDAFAASHKAQFDQLAAIRRDAAAAVKAGKTRDEVRAILEKGRPIMESMQKDFEALRAAVGALLTAEQKQWASEHQRRGGGPMGGPMPGAPMAGGPMGGGSMPGRP